MANNVLHPITREFLERHMYESYENGHETYSLSCNNVTDGISGYISIAFADEDEILPSIITIGCSNGNSLTIQRQGCMNLPDLMMAINTVFRSDIKHFPEICKFVNSFGFEITVEIDFTKQAV